jgi:hypothetical protein
MRYILAYEKWGKKYKNASILDKKKNIYIYHERKREKRIIFV